MLSEVAGNISPLLEKFHPDIVFSSISNFLGSGYVGILVLIILVMGIVKQITKLIMWAAVIALIWVLYTTGSLDGILEPVQHFLSNVMPA